MCKTPFCELHELTGTASSTLAKIQLQSKVTDVSQWTLLDNSSIQIRKCDILKDPEHRNMGMYLKIVECF